GLEVEEEEPIPVVEPRLIGDGRSVALDALPVGGDVDELPPAVTADDDRELARREDPLEAEVARPVLADLVDVLLDQPRRAAGQGQVAALGGGALGGVAVLARLADARRDGDPALA